jgi:hypothetical protein
MKKTFEHILPDGSQIWDFKTKLVILSADFIELRKTMAECDWRHSLMACKAEFFTTKADRQAIRLSVGHSHKVLISTFQGSKSFRNWSERKDPTALFAHAIPISNGGGCWAEITLNQA